MASSLLNAPRPNLIGCTTFGKRGSETYRDRELQARRYYLEQAAKGNAEARLMCRTYLHLTGWYNRDLGGDVIGCHLSQVAKERERG